METLQLSDLITSVICFLLSYGCAAVIYRWWIHPMGVKIRLERSGFRGPSPSFPLGNIMEMRKLSGGSRDDGTPCIISHDIHPLVSPYFAHWRKEFGKVFMYWLGTEPFLYVAEPEFIKLMISACDQSKSWGKPSVFREDRKALFGNGLVMLEGDNWSRRRRTISPAFSPSNLKNMGSLMVASTCSMLEKWRRQMKGGSAEIDVERDIIRTTADVIAKAIFGLNYREEEKQVMEKIRSVHGALFRDQRLVGVPFTNAFNIKQSWRIHGLGKEIDRLILSVIKEQRGGDEPSSAHLDLVGLLLKKEIDETSRHPETEVFDQDLLDDCKTFVFGGHETSALALTWTLFLLALNPEWQHSLREEVLEVTKGLPIDADVLPELKKMTWVMNEVLRLYPPSPNAQRQAMEDIQVREFSVPRGTNIWLDIVGMNHDPALWGEDVDEFKPERFKEVGRSTAAACNHRMGFIPFGVGTRTCVGQNLFRLEYKIVLSMILTSFSWSLSSNYSHSPSIVFTLRPSFGVPLVLRPLAPDR
ncbi:unnamed protein product [Victoria cruziana]